jgi:hypothetical protein
MIAISPENSCERDICAVKTKKSLPTRAIYVPAPLIPNRPQPTGEMAFSSVSFLPAKWTHTLKFPCVVKKESIFFSVIQQKLTTWSVGETFIWCRTCQVIISSSRLGFVSIRDRVLNCVSVFVLASFSNSFGPGMFVWILFQIINIFKVVRLIDLDKEGNVFLIFCVCERLV